jgi:hypothetical protein
MNYTDGQEIRLWDRVVFDDDDTVHGVVVFSIDTDEYSPQFPREQWSHLGHGVMLVTDQMGPIHYDSSADELRLVGRGQPYEPNDWAKLQRSRFDRNPGEWREGSGGSVRVGYVNPNGQICLGHRGTAGTDHGQFAYWTLCGWCGKNYGANGSDLHLRLCPECQGGRPGLPY